MAKAKRALKKFNFEQEGSSVALVSSSQGGPANGITTLVTKATDTVDVKKAIKEALQKSVTVEMSIMEFLVQYLDLYWDDAEIVANLMGFTPEEINAYWAGDLDGTMSYIESRLSKINVNKSATAKEFLGKFEEFKNTVELFKKAGVTKDTTTTEEEKPTIHKGVTNMSLTNEEIQVQINKALAEQREAILAEVETVHKQREDKLSAELQVLKAREEDRQNAIFKEQAEGVKQVLGDAVDVEVLTKALRTANSAEDSKPLVALVKSLVEVSTKESVLVEKGANAVKEPEDTSDDAKVESLAKSMREADPTLTSHAAYVKAFEQIHSA